MAILKREGTLDKHPMCVAIIGGDPEADPARMTAEMLRLQNLRIELGIGDIVAFLGKRDQDTLQYYYSAADMVVVPSHYESFGMVALEAMACGAPVVASETGGLAFLVKDGETGFHVPTADAEALAARLKLLAEDDALRTRLGQQAAAYARTFSWAHIAPQIVHVYKSMLERVA